MNFNGSFTNIEKSSTYMYDTYILIVVRETGNVKTGQHVICVLKSLLLLYFQETLLKEVLFGANAYGGVF